jgi:hypothetical protein
MDVTADDLAGIVELFGALTRAELQRALAELAYKSAGDFEPESFAVDVEAARRSYHLLAVPPPAVDGDPIERADVSTWVVPGPLAFPELPEDATDLPHILDIDERSVDHSAVDRAAEERFRADAAAAIDAGDSDRVAALRDVSYELESWSAVDLSAARERLDAAE